MLTGELSIRPGAYGFAEARAAARDSLTRIPLAVAAGPVPVPMGGNHRTPNLVRAAARRIRVIVSTLWEAAWAEIDIPGRPADA